MSLPPPYPGEDRSYRRLSGVPHLPTFEIRVEETDLRVQARLELRDRCREKVIEAREALGRYIRSHPHFLKTTEPWRLAGPAPALVRLMTEASLKTGVGPMAAVAGAIAETVGRDLLEVSDEVVVENGGDIFLSLRSESVIGLYAGASPLSLRIGIRMPGGLGPCGVCTSSGTVGHSMSRGRADAACVMAPSAALADAAATAVANRVSKEDEIAPAIEWARNLADVQGVVVVKSAKIGMWGAMEIVPLKGKRG
ncbi:MAG: UPF0280 family protein [Desulfobacterales bacterium]